MGNSKIFMKMLFIIDTLGSGGAQRQLINISAGLQKRGNKVDIFVYNYKGNFFKDKLLNKKVNIIKNFKKNRGFSIQVVKELRNILKNNEYDICISFLDNASIYLLVSSFNLKKKIIFCERSSYLDYRYKFLAVIIRQLYRYSNHIICNSYTQKKWLIDKAKLKKTKISTIYNGYPETDNLSKNEYINGSNKNTHI